MEMKDSEFKSIVFFLVVLCVTGCEERKVDYKRNTGIYTNGMTGGQSFGNIETLPGKNESIPVEVLQQGEVYIAYSDCYTCHKEERRSVGPPFKAIAKRYPSNNVYIGMLAQKVIVGGSGAWGQAIMPAHKDVPVENAKKMVSYILSLKP